MPHSAEISRTAPAAFLFLLDQSASMQDPFGGAERKGPEAPTKARVLADVVNTLLRNLVLRCAKEDGVRDYFHVGVVGYGARVQPLVRPDAALGDALDLIPISHLAERPLRLETRFQPEAPDRPVRVPVWFEPQARNGTPMCQALDLAAQMVRRWIDRYPSGFPPIVLNLTDGEATDGDPLRYARLLTDLATDDGDTLLFNAHLSDRTTDPVEFPDGLAGLPDGYAEQLFQMSSRLPFALRAAAEREGYAVTAETRGFLFNADPAALVRFLEIGTRPSTLR